MAFAQLTLIRHGKSEWNSQNRFTGWEDVPLAPDGMAEARQAGQALLAAGLGQYDVAYTSYLRRAIHTLWLVLEELDLMWIPQHHDWRFNERHYGSLQGKNKQEATAQFGKEQVQKWRRGYADLPPAINGKQAIESDNRYKNVTVPTGESLQTMMPRVVAAFDEHIAPQLKDGKNCLLVAHGNSLRGLVKHLENLDEERTTTIEIPTGKPFYYEFNRELKITAKWSLNPTA